MHGPWFGELEQIHHFQRGYVVVVYVFVTVGKIHGRVGKRFKRERTKLSALSILYSENYVPTVVQIRCSVTRSPHPFIFNLKPDMVCLLPRSPPTSPPLPSLLQPHSQPAGSQARSTLPSQGHCTYSACRNHVAPLNHSDVFSQRGAPQQPL